MDSGEPDATGRAELPRSALARHWRFTRLFAPLGFLMGAGVPVSIVWSWLHFRPALPPGQVSCGTQALGISVLALILSPLTGIVGAVLGACLGGFVGTMQQSVSELRERDND